MKTCPSCARENADDARFCSACGTALDATAARPLSRLRAAERLLAEGRRPDAEAQLERAVAFYRSVGATRYLRRADDLLADAGLEVPA